MLYRFKKFKIFFNYYCKIIKGLIFFFIPNIFFIFKVYKYRINYKKQNKNYDNIFLITSCINQFDKNYYNHNTNHTQSQRYNELLNTILSIKKKKFKNIFIAVVDNSKINKIMKANLNKHVDLYLDISDKKLSNLSRLYGNKGVPWATSIMITLNKIFEYEFSFLHIMSGRYYLNNYYDIKNFKKNKINFRYYKNFSNVSTRYFCAHNQDNKYIFNLFKKIIIFSLFNISCEDNMFHIVDKRKANLIEKNIGLAGQVNGIHQINE